ncbi:MAG TPA: outer membrane protein assembly factor BamD [Candidatus Eisenbacteria bacterium]
MIRLAVPRTLARAGVAALLVLASGCGGSLREAAVGGVASFDRGKEAFDRGDWMDAIADFKAYVEQFPGTEKTDDALFYLGEAYFRTKDYALASGQYDRLIRDFPGSPLHPDALYQLARCDDLQSRPAPLDQTETTRAIGRYKEFLELYPEHARAAEAKKRLEALTDRLAEKRWRNGRLYYRLKHYDAAENYFRSVITGYPTSVWASESQLLLADVLVRKKKRAEAVTVLRAVEESVASADVKARAQKRLRELEGAKE